MSIGAHHREPLTSWSLSPSVAERCVHDIALPYDRNWDLFQRLQQPILKGCPIVLTSTDPTPR